MSNTRVSFDVLDAKSETVNDLINRMLTGKMSHVVISYGEHMHVHVALMFDRVESSRLQEHLSKVTQIAIVKANARATDS